MILNPTELLGLGAVPGPELERFIDWVAEVTDRNRVRPARELDNVDIFLTRIRGLVNYAAADLRRIAGLRTERIAEVLGSTPYAEVVHRDNLAIIDRSGADPR